MEGSTKKYEEIKRKIGEGELLKCNKMVSAAYLLASISDTWLEEGLDVLRKYGLMHHNLKYFYKNYFDAFTKFNRILADMIVDEQSRQALELDYEFLDGIVRCYVFEENDNKWNDKVRSQYYEFLYNKEKEQSEKFCKTCNELLEQNEALKMQLTELEGHIKEVEGGSTAQKQKKKKEFTQTIKIQ